MDVDKLSIDPWSSTQSTDYSRIIQQFGLSDFNNLTLPDPSHLHRAELSLPIVTWTSCSTPRKPETSSVF